MHTSGSAHTREAGAAEHPSLEALAAFLDGKLADAERKQVMKHLAACKSCFRLFADTARTLRELEPAGGKVLRFPFLARPEVRWALPAAAAAVLVAAVGIVTHGPVWGTPRMEVSDLAGALPDKAARSADILTPRDRGEDDLTLVGQAEAFQLGARLLEFQVAVEGGNAVKAEWAARSLWRLFDGNVGYGEQAVLFKEATSALAREGAEPEDFRSLVGEVAPAVDEGFWRPFTDLGMWTAAGRLAALAEDPRFFEERRNRRFLTLLLEDPARLDRDEPPVLLADVQEELEKVAASWEERDYDAIEEALRRVLGIYENMTADL